MSEALIRAQIKVELEKVSGIGVIHDYQRYARSIADFKNIMIKTGTSIVNGWIVHRIATESAQAVMGIKGQIERVHTYRIAGIYEHDDANSSETTFQGILDGIFAQFKANGTLNGTAISHKQIQIDSVDVTKEGEFGDDIYHWAELTLEVMERTAIS